MNKVSMATIISESTIVKSNYKFYELMAMKKEDLEKIFEEFKKKETEIILKGE